jgi:hypothetical protein
LTHFKRVLSFSNVIAVLALFFALGGTVYAAAKISGAQIKPKSIPANRIKPKSLTGSQIKPKSLTGSQIKPGSLTGTQIAEGSLQGVSASSLASVQYAVAAVPIVSEAPSGTSGTAACPSGQKVIGGGATVNNENFGFINDSGPTADRGGWVATGFSGIPGVTMTVTAICTTVVSPLG